MSTNSFSSVARPVIDKGQSLGGKYRIEKKNDTNNGVWWYLLNKLSSGSVVVVNEKEYVLTDADEENIYTSDGQIIPKIRISEMKLNSSEIDDTYFLESCQPRAIWQSKSVPVIWRPELADGYIVMSEKLNKEKADDKWNVYYAAKSININGKNQTFLKPTLPEDVRTTDETDIQVGDIIVGYSSDTANKQVTRITEIYKVLGSDNTSDPSEQKYIVEFRQFVIDDEGYKYGNEIKVLSLTADDLLDDSDTEHYRRKSYNKSSYRQLYNQSENAACTEFLLNLEEITGLNVIFDSDENIFRDEFGHSAFAFVDETGIHINMSKKPENMSREAYIMS
jgi:hypothetical protein